MNHKDSELIKKITSTFNNELIFDAEANQMSYTIRDPISMVTQINDYPDKASEMVQVWSLSSFEVSCQLLTNDLNQVSFFFMLISFFDGS